MFCLVFTNNGDRQIEKKKVSSITYTPFMIGDFQFFLPKLHKAIKRFFQHRDFSNNPHIYTMLWKSDLTPYRSPYLFDG